MTKSFHVRKTFVNPLPLEQGVFGLIGMAGGILRGSDLILVTMVTDCRELLGYHGLINRRQSGQSIKRGNIYETPY